MIKLAKKGGFISIKYIADLTQLIVKIKLFWGVFLLYNPVQNKGMNKSLKTLWGCRNY